MTNEQFSMNNTHYMYCTMMNKFYHRKYMLKKKSSDESLTSDEIYLVIKVKIVKEVKRSDGF